MTFFFIPQPAKKKRSLSNVSTIFKGQRKNLKSCERFCTCAIDSYNETTG